MTMSLVFLLACADKAADTAAPVPFSVVWDEVLLPSCAFSSCHGSGAGGLTLDPTGAWGALVEVASTAAPGERLVIPGDVEDSYLIKKLESSSDIVGGPMPPDAALDDARLDLVRAWIGAGAAG